MIELSSEIKLIKNGLLNFEGSKFLFDLYLPLIGSDATFLYLFFANKVKKEEDDSTLEKLVNESQLNLQNFLLAKKTLESIGLISFFKKKNEEKYLLIVTDVLTPKNFFNNLTLKGLFCQRVGSEEAEKILKKYEIKRSYKDYDNISAKINDSFTIDFNPDFLELNKGMELEGYNKNEIRDDFSLVKFLNYLKKETQIRVNSISDEELDYIKRIATLYGLKEKDIGGILTECFIPEESKGNKVDQAKLKNIARTYVKSYQVSKNKTEKKTKLNSTSDIAALIKYYESISPKEFLKSKQNGVEISEADLNLIETLSFNVGFSNGMINALLDQVLKTKNGELSKNYVLKIATTLVRKGCKNTLDCLEEFNKKKIDSNKKEVILSPKNSIKNSNESTQNVENIEEEDDGKSFFDEE